MRLRLFRLKKLKSEEKGQSLVEFALLSVPLLLLLLGIIEFGWLFNGQIVLTGAAREGARTAAVIGDVPQNILHKEVREAITQHVSATALTVTKVSVEPGGPKLNRHYNVQVTAEIEPLVGLFVSDTVSLGAAATMRIE